MPNSNTSLEQLAGMETIVLKPASPTPETLFGVPYTSPFAISKAGQALNLPTKQPADSWGRNLPIARFPHPKHEDSPGGSDEGSVPTSGMRHSALPNIVNGQADEPSSTVTIPVTIEKKKHSWCRRFLSKARARCVRWLPTTQRRAHPTAAVSHALETSVGRSCTGGCFNWGPKQTFSKLVRPNRQPLDDYSFIDTSVASKPPHPAEV